MLPNKFYTDFFCMLPKAGKNCIRDKNINIVTSLFAQDYGTPWLRLRPTIQTIEKQPCKLERKQLTH